MKTIKIIAAVIIVVMATGFMRILLGSGLNHGVGFDTFLSGINDPWQTFINNDLVMGLVLTISWIIFRERGGRTIDTVLWVWLAAWWGNVVVATYVFRAATESRGDWSRFFMGQRAADARDGAAVGASGLVRALAAAVAIAVAIYLVMALRATGLTPIAVIGYLAAFPPVILAAALIAARR